MEDASSTSYADTKAIDHLAAKPRCSPEQRNANPHSRQVQKWMPGGDPHARADPPEQEPAEERPSLFLQRAKHSKRAAADRRAIGK